MIPRAPEPGETEPLARPWHAAWHRAHAGLVPSELVASRTVEDFRARLGKLLADTRVTGPADAPVGLCVVRGAELYQLYVAERA